MVPRRTLEIVSCLPKVGDLWVKARDHRSCCARLVANKAKCVPWVSLAQRTSTRAPWQSFGGSLLAIHSGPGIQVSPLET